jgi:hypothetical protein
MGPRREGSGLIDKEAMRWVAVSLWVEVVRLIMFGGQVPPLRPPTADFGRDDVGWWAWVGLVSDLGWFL